MRQKPVGTRALSKEELQRAWNGTGVSPASHLAVKLLLATGQRVEEVLQASWDEFDFDEGLWTIPAGSVASVIEHVRATVNDPDVTVRQGSKPSSEPSAISDVDSPSFASLHQTVRQVFPDVVVAPGLLIGRTDSRYYAGIADNSYRFLPMRLGQLDLKRIHGTDERISVENYIEIIRFYAQLMRNTAMH